MGDDRPFVCNAPGCGQRFTNEDHLAVHKHKHEMTLKFGPARTDSVIIADQTPTPTRFLKNCEEVGLFNELASSFEHEFKKAADEDEKKAAAGPLDMSLPSTPDIKIKEEEPVEVDSSPADSPASSPCSPPLKEKEVAPKPVVISTPTPTIVRPGSLPLHLGYDPLHPTLPSPTSVITQAPPSNRQLGSPTGSLPLVMHLANGQTMPVLPGPPVQMPSVISLARPVSMVPNIPGIPGPPVNSSGSISPSGHPMPSEAKMRLKATLTHQVSSINGGCGMVVGTASTMVTARPEQSQILIQHPDAPSPAQPQVSPAQPTPSTGGRRRRTVDEDPDERRQRFLERNRAAASRCRQKRKLWVSSLEKKAEELTSQNIQLSNEVTLLRNEVAQLKQLLLAHKDCPVTALQKKTQGYLGQKEQRFLSLLLMQGRHSLEKEEDSRPHPLQEAQTPGSFLHSLLQAMQRHGRSSAFRFQPQRFGGNTRGSWSSEQLGPRAGEELSAPFWSLAAPQRFGKK
ncbi:cyclic AMP-dependent transcription factor ATF-7 isoform X3 [Panthera uncia]|uniref:cyclic AMP-dependent transcription factor ATF-7 isoform X3 n=1 Tax=Panthera uncia TaxID=29064 RepID=UPI0020FFD357|nr:cyclic AMP-dependent transcription factor ATF-7 isoform X3 [Panthera uncia]